MNGATDTSLDFGFVTPSVSVGDYVFADVNRDGVQNAGDVGIAGVTLTLTGPGIATPLVTTSGTDGKYLFPNLPVLAAGQHYTVTITPPAGYQPTLTDRAPPPRIRPPAPRFRPP